MVAVAGALALTPVAGATHAGQFQLAHINTVPASDEGNGLNCNQAKPCLNVIQNDTTFQGQALRASSAGDGWGVQGLSQTGIGVFGQHQAATGLSPASRAKRAPSRTARRASSGMCSRPARVISRAGSAVRTPPPRRRAGAFLGSQNGSGIGVLGQTPFGIGVFGYGGSFGVIGYSNAGGFAGYFGGDVCVAGTLTGRDPQGCLCERPPDPAGGREASFAAGQVPLPGAVRKARREERVQAARWGGEALS